MFDAHVQVVDFLSPGFWLPKWQPVRIQMLGLGLVPELIELNPRHTKHTGIRSPTEIEPRVYPQSVPAELAGHWTKKLVCCAAIVVAEHRQIVQGRWSRILVRDGVRASLSMSLSQG